MEKIKTNNLLLILTITMLFVFFSVLITTNVSAQSSVTWCAEKTLDGAYCQNVLQDQIDPNFRSSPTSCDSTSFCQLGCCYDSSEGLCGENVPESACNANDGIWSDSPNCQIPQCEAGCCVLGTEAAFTSLQRCKVLAGNFGLQADFRTDIQDEVSCVQLATNQDVGACVFESEFTRTCEFTTRGQCNSQALTDEGLTNPNTQFFQDTLCTSENLNTNCQRTKQTSCFSGKDEVYFVDTCGNPANIYDASKVDDLNYWNDVVEKEDSCASNPNSRTCGNCDYLAGSLCGESERGRGPVHGNNICTNLNCFDTANGNDYKNGESWCLFDNGDSEVDSVGSRYFRHTCFVGEETIESCSDFRQEVCIESSIGDGGDSFSQAGCVVNRWQDCVIQGEERDCTNIDKRDCTWIVESTEGSQFINNREAGKCVPTIAPGLQFWDPSALSQCEIGSQTCIVKFETKLLGDRKCVENCHCLTEEYEQQANNICTAIGDCGADSNYVGVFVDEGYDIDIRSGGKDLDQRKPASPGGQPTFGGAPQTTFNTQPSTSGNVIQGLVVKSYNQLSGAKS